MTKKKQARQRSVMCVCGHSSRSHGTSQAPWGCKANNCSCVRSAAQARASLQPEPDRAEGRKHDEGKIDLRVMLHPLLTNTKIVGALAGAVRVLEHGAGEYGADNWEGVEYVRYEKALLRHMREYLVGSHADERSGESHLSHIICNALFLGGLRESE